MQPIEVIDSTIARLEPEFSKTVLAQGWHLIPKTQLLAAKRQIMRNDYSMKLASQNPQSLYDAIMTAAIIGVDLTEGKRQGWLVPRDGGIAFQVGYKGIEAVHQRLGVIQRLVVRTVHQGDTLAWSGDDQEKPIHTADWFNDKARGDMVGAYAITYFPDGSYQVMSESIEAINRDHRDKSDSWKNEKSRKFSPWSNHIKAMVEKTMAIIASKQWPAASQDKEHASEVLERLHQAETADYSVYKKDDVVVVNDMHAFMLAGDALGLYLFLNAIPAEEQMQYYWWPASPKGLKGACREHHQRMLESGQELYQRILQAIDAGHDYQLAECLELATGTTRKLLADQVGTQKTAIIKAMMAGKAAA